MIWQTLQQERDRVSTENRSLMTRLNALTDILTTQEHYISHVSFISPHCHVIIDWHFSALITFRLSLQMASGH